MAGRIFKKIDDHLRNQLPIHGRRDDLIRQPDGELSAAKQMLRVLHGLAHDIVDNLLLFVQHKLLFTDPRHA
ncbi:hypothetical protein SDC9_85311 [bioreactor metagenome]|uniref:Uncharacterized protein n=1 Tax=bioreactor metagenome TaxID=1076179 RepID=A0A644ZFL7_9ZZZZ